MALIYTAALLVLLFHCSGIFVQEPRVLHAEPMVAKKEKQGSSLRDGINILFPVWFYCIQIICGHHKMILHGRWDLYQTQCMDFVFYYISIRHHHYSQRKTSSFDTNDFQKILLAHAFFPGWAYKACLSRVIFHQGKKWCRCWLSRMLLPMPFQDSFAAKPTEEQTAGNILSLGFLLLNFVGALLPVLLLEPLSKRIGTVKV